LIERLGTVPLLAK